VRAPAAAVARRLGAGHPLDGAVRSPMERAFGRSFADVRIHADRPAAALSEGLNARAFTLGHDIAFGPNQFKPGTPAGDALIAHELAHVVQQAMPARATSDSTLERDADTAAAAALGGGRAVTSSGGGLRLQRCKDGGSGKVPKIEVSVQPVSVANDDGSSPTAVPSFASAQTIWAKCCLTFKVAAAKTVSKTALRVLNEAPHPATPTTPNAEEQELMTAAGAGGGTIFVIIPETFKDGANVSKNIRGGGTTRQLNLADATCFLVEGSDPTNVAHELGHAMGIRSHTAGTVMEGSGAYDKPNPTSVSAALCNTVRSFPYGKASSSSDCDITP